MSADNWAVCPRCKLKPEVDHFAIKAEMMSKAQEAYGKVSPGEYEDLKKAAQDYDDDPELPTNFREDYEQGVSDDGSYSVSYHGECQDCGFKFTFKYEEKLDLNQKPKGSK